MDGENFMENPMNKSGQFIINPYPNLRRRGDRWPREILHIEQFRLHATQIFVFGQRAQRFCGVGWGGGGGVGWGAITFTFLVHMFDATHLSLLTCSMLRNCSCAHVRCYAVVLARMFDATEYCLCSHVRCYAIVLAHMFDAPHEVFDTVIFLL